MALRRSSIHPFNMPTSPHGGEDDYGFFIDDEERSLNEDVDSARIDLRTSFESSECLESFPQILSPLMIEQIGGCGLSHVPCDHMWNRLYSSTRDGSSFGTFLRKVRGFTNTLIVAKTSCDDIVGLFATAPWSGRKKDENQISADSFLFSVHPESSTTELHSCKPKKYSCFIPGFEPFGKSPTTTIIGDDPELETSPTLDREHVSIYKCQGARQYNQMCHISDKRISVGGKDGTVAFCVWDSFSRGSSYPCNAYATSFSLASSENFDIVEFEVYGLSSKEAV
eukprot:13857960-Ditylum_brightwellii.AAC.1